MSYIDNTWLAYACEHQPDEAAIEAGLMRVERHYAGLVREPLQRSHERSGPLGMALWDRPDERLRWPLWAQGEGLTVAVTNAPTGWERVVGPLAPAAAALPLGRAIAADPIRAGELGSPTVIAVLDGKAGRLTIANDFLGTARLYAMRTPGGWAWSNRLGALPLFAGVRPESDPHSWALVAAIGWFVGRFTPLRGVENVVPGCAIVAERTGSGATASGAPSGAVRDLVRPRRRRSFRRSVDALAEQTIGIGQSIDALWSVPPVVNLSGGKDSRVSAAGLIVAGVDARYRTNDVDPGEAEFVAKLVDRLGEPIEHTVNEPEGNEPDGDLRARARALHLVHDAVNNPMSILRHPPKLPQEGFRPPLVTGHAGDLAHGFYYSASSLGDVRKAGEEQLTKRLMRYAHQGHDAATAEAYAAYEEEARRTLREAADHGLAQPEQLDYFFMRHRTAYRGSLQSRNDRYSACATPAYVRGSFDTKAERRLEGALSAAVAAKLIPAWADAGYFKAQGGRMRERNRRRLWERPGDAVQFTEMLAADELWGEHYDAAKVRAMWAEAQAGEARPNYEPVFARIAWRVCFEDHRALLAERAGP